MLGNVGFVGPRENEEKLAGSEPGLRAEGHSLGRISTCYLLCARDEGAERVANILLLATHRSVQQRARRTINWRYPRAAAGIRDLQVLKSLV